MNFRRTSCVEELTCLLQRNSSTVNCNMFKMFRLFNLLTFVRILTHLIRLRTNVTGTKFHHDGHRHWWLALPLPLPKFGCLVAYVVNCWNCLLTVQWFVHSYLLVCSTVEAETEMVSPCTTSSSKSTQLFLITHCTWYGSLIFNVVLGDVCVSCL